MTKDDQRRRHARLMMLAVGLECHLRNLVHKILRDDAEALVEFQQFVQYAPESTRVRIQDFLEDHGQAISEKFED